MSIWPLYAVEQSAKPLNQETTKDLTALEIELVELTNKVRLKKGLHPLKISGPLMMAARKHSSRMGRKQHLSHLIKGKSFTYRLKKAGYVFAKAGENVGHTKKPSAHIIKLWMKSHGHRNNLLNPHFKDIGVGIYTNPDGDKYFTQIFGTKG
jgi:uncharacterized protein YkwD